MTNSEVNDFPIGSDTPQTDPVNDAYGYAPFAQRIANAACKTPSPQGLVMAIHGAWGTGKTTLLNFVKYYLDRVPEAERAVVIDFNPWWFNGREHLATQFLSQFRTNLPHESELLLTIGDMMADYANALGTIIANTYGIPWLDKPIQFFLKFLKSKPKDVPAIKAKIAKALQQAGQRFVFVIDDIDRLTPEEIREFFKVIKALSDFPNVVYLLSFDRNAVAKALKTVLRVDGEAYLEKIVQVPFSLPAVDRLRVREKLFKELDRILASFPLSNFDQTYWGNIYFDGLDCYTNKPRDIVRIINTLSVTYPAVVGEVNPIDFIAIEFLRLFEPGVYEVIRDHRDIFAGCSYHNHTQKEENTFHEAWLSTVATGRRTSVKALLLNLFPKLASVWGNTNYDANWLSEWRKKLRICSPDIFDVYFQFGVSSNSLRRSEIDELIAVAVDPEKAIQILESASTIKRPNGTSKAREYLERLRDFTDEIKPESATGLLATIFDAGDMLLVAEHDQVGMTSVPYNWSLHYTINHLLKRIATTEQKTLLTKIVTQGKAIRMIADIVSLIEDYQSKPENAHNSPFVQIDEQQLKELKAIVINRLYRLDEKQLLLIPDLASVINVWIRWAGSNVVIKRVAPIFDSDILLPVILEKYLRFATTQGVGDRVARRVPLLNPKNFESLTNIAALEPRVEKMLSRNDLTATQRTAGERFLKGMKLIRQGKDPDSLFLLDDE